MKVLSMLPRNRLTAPVAVPAVARDGPRNELVDLWHLPLYSSLILRLTLAISDRGLWSVYTATLSPPAHRKRLFENTLRTALLGAPREVGGVSHSRVYAHALKSFELRRDG